MCCKGWIFTGSGKVLGNIPGIMFQILSIDNVILTVVLEPERKVIGSATFNVIVTVVWEPVRKVIGSATLGKYLCYLVSVGETPYFNKKSTNPQKKIFLKEEMPGSLNFAL